ncbi:MAG: acetyltransferase, family [Rhodospirillales bacterium]|nr:acetyltransferase, family [Rhodospirillales bacterium]
MEDERFRTSVEIAIRAARRDDLAPLEWSGWFGGHRAIIHDTFAAAERGEAVFLVADSGGFPVGQAWVDLRPAPATALLWAVRVLPGLQGAGIGRRLIASCEARIRAAGINAVAIAVEKNNDRAEALYRRLGYRRVGEHCGKWRYTDPGGAPADMDLDQWVLEKSLGRSLVAIRQPRRSRACVRPIARR